jgi:hypothetical protein
VAEAKDNRGAGYLKRGWGSELRPLPAKTCGMYHPAKTCGTFRSSQPLGCSKLNAAQTFEKNDSRVRNWLRAINPAATK